MTVLFVETNEVVINCALGELDDRVVSRLIKEHLSSYFTSLQFICHSHFSELSIPADVYDIITDDLQDDSARGLVLQEGGFHLGGPHHNKR